VLLRKGTASLFFYPPVFIMFSVGDGAPRMLRAHAEPPRRLYREVQRHAPVGLAKEPRLMPERGEHGAGSSCSQWDMSAPALRSASPSQTSSRLSSKPFRFA
jgi:hypothetical protein